MEHYLNGVINSITFSAIGIIMFLICFFIIEKITPEKSWKEIVENRNIGLAIIFASIIIGISIIISSSIHE